MNTDIIRSTALYDSAVEASWGKDSRVLWQWKGAGICVFCFCVWGGWWWWFLVSVHTPPPITSCSPWHRGKEFAIWRRPGCTLDMAAPAGLQWRPGACIGSVYWLGDKFPVVFWEVWARGGGAALLRVSFGGNGRDEVLRRWHPVNICLTTLQGRSDVWERYANMSRAHAIISMLSPAYQCLKHPLVLSD